MTDSVQISLKSWPNDMGFRMPAALFLKFGELTAGFDRDVTPYDLELWLARVLETMGYAVHLDEPKDDDEAADQAEIIAKYRGAAPDNTPRDNLKITRIEHWGDCDLCGSHVDLTLQVTGNWALRDHIEFHESGHMKASAAPTQWGRSIWDLFAELGVNATLCAEFLGESPRRTEQEGFLDHVEF